ncbi:MAG: DUF6166 domain-containing protein [Bdellovibrionota bacterium]
MKRYTGQRTDRQTFVVVQVENADHEYLLNPRIDLKNHSPDGFEWGYGGSGPAQLAFAILADHLEDDGRAEDTYQRFKELVIAPLKDEAWVLTSQQVDRALKEIEQEIGIHG